MSTKKRPNSRHPNPRASNPRAGNPRASNPRAGDSGRPGARRTRQTVTPTGATPGSVRGRAADPATGLETVEPGEQLPPTGALYPQVLRTPEANLGRSVAGLAIGLALFLVAALTLIPQVVSLLSWLVVGNGRRYPDYFAAASRFELPGGMLAANLGLAAMIPIAMGLVGFVHRVRPRWLSSVGPGLRWRYLFLALGVAVLALGGVNLLTTVLGPAVSFHPQQGFWAFLVVIVLTSPLQAAGEEYFFRGYLMQAFGSVVANPWFGIVASSLLFALAHLSLDPALFVDRLAFGLAAAVLVRLTGGLEAGIAAHVVNNLLAFILAGLTGTIASARTLTTVSWATAGVDVGAFVLFAVLAWLVARALKLRTRVGGRAPERLSGLGDG